MLPENGPRELFVTNHRRGDSGLFTPALTVALTRLVSKPSVLVLRLRRTMRRSALVQRLFIRTQKPLSGCLPKILITLLKRRIARVSARPRPILTIPVWVTSFLVILTVPLPMRQKLISFLRVSLSLKDLILKFLAPPELLLVLVKSRVRKLQLKVPKLIISANSPLSRAVLPVRGTIPFVLRLLKLPLCNQ